LERKPLEKWSDRSLAFLFWLCVCSFAVITAGLLFAYSKTGFDFLTGPAPVVPTVYLFEDNSGHYLIYVHSRTIQLKTDINFNLPPMQCEEFSGGIDYLHLNVAINMKPVENSLCGI
jgi:hypothetical protein